MTQPDFDAIIVGGGLAGLTGALALDQAGLSVCVIDREPLSTRLSKAFDGRTAAIAYANFRIFEALGAADDMREHAAPIRKILVSDGRPADPLKPGGPDGFFLHFDAEEVTRDPDADTPLGFILENRTMRAALARAIKAHKGIVAKAPHSVTQIAFEPAFGKVTLDNGKTLNARVIIGCDGRRSRCREAAGIRQFERDYHQDALVFNVAHDAPHEGIAHEYFLPSGPFAILPLTGHRSSIVWSEKRRAAQALMALPEDVFEAEIRRRFGNFLGDVRLDSPRWSYPLNRVVSERAYAHRLALVGDAARGIHPIAGQGFNLGLKDVAALAEVLGEALEVGLDPGALDRMEAYARWRGFDSLSMAMGMDGFTDLFSNDIAPVRMARGIGMSLVNSAGPLRRFFARHAGADTGELPQLLQGIPLGAGS